MPKRHPPITLSGSVYCSWNSFSFVRPVPDRLRTGDMVVWSWSGNSAQPKSGQNCGLFRASVFDGKTRRFLKVKNTRIHRILAFRTDDERERHLQVIVRELLRLKGRAVEWSAGKPSGYEVALPEEGVGKSSARAPTSAAALQPTEPTTKTAKPSSSRRTSRHIQPTLFD